MLVLLIFVALAAVAQADIVYENELIKTTEIFDLDYALDSSVWAYDQNKNVSKYYCVFRNNWNPENHPADFPELARWANPVLFSHTKEYAPFIKNRAAPQGVETIAEVGKSVTAQRQGVHPPTARKMYCLVAFQAQTYSLPQIVMDTLYHTQPRTKLTSNCCSYYIFAGRFS